VFTTGYPGPTYTVKYLGIVDGSMGILSRKMALGGTDPVVKPLSTVDLPSKVSEKTAQHLVRSQINIMPNQAANFIKPVLGQKNYSKRLQEKQQ